MEWAIVLKRACNSDTAFGQSLGQHRLDTHGNEAFAAVRRRLLQGAGDVLVTDVDISNPPSINHLLELTVGDGVDLSAFDPPVLDRKNRQHRRDQVPAVDLRIFGSCV
jgi:hypothetical protein